MNHEASELAHSRSSWRQRVAQCIFDTGWTQVRWLLLLLLLLLVVVGLRTSWSTKMDPCPTSKSVWLTVTPSVCSSEGPVFSTSIRTRLDESSASLISTSPCVVVNKCPETSGKRPHRRGLVTAGGGECTRPLPALDRRRVRNVLVLRYVTKGRNVSASKV